MPYPRLCAHRGFNTVAPENSLPAYGAAVALGAEEIEFDLWSTKDGVIVSCHDSTLDRVSDGTGVISDHTYEELLQLDFGADKVQLCKPEFDQAMIDKAHAHGIRCNVFWADDPEEAKRYFKMGITLY